MKLEVGKNSYGGLLGWWADLENGEPTNVSGRRQRWKGSPQTVCFKAVWEKVGEAGPGKDTEAD